METHLAAPAQLIVEEYFSAKRKWLTDCLIGQHLVGMKDVSDIIRGKILALDDVLQTRSVFKRYEDLQQKVKKGAN